MKKTPSIVNLIRTYPKAIIINTDLIQSGILEGKILVDAWNTNKEVLDKNKDNIMQYIAIKGPSDSNITNIRTKYSIKQINESGIKTQELSSVTCNFQEECARTATIYPGSGFQNPGMFFQAHFAGHIKHTADTDGCIDQYLSGIR